MKRFRKDCRQCLRHRPDLRDPTDENSLTESRKVQSRTEEITRSFPGNSVTVLRIATKW